MSSRPNPVQAFDPDQFHSRYTRLQGGFDPDEFHEQYTRQSDPLVTGNGMQENAQQEAHEQLASTIPPGKSMRQRFEPIAARNQTPAQKEFQSKNIVPALEGLATAGSVAVPFADAGGFLPGLAKLATSAGGGYLGSRVGEKYGGPVGKFLGGAAGSILGYGAPNVAEGVANRVVGEENVPMWLKSPQTVGRMVDTARDEMNQDFEARHNAFAENLAATEKARLKELGDWERLRTQHANSLMSRGDELGSPENPGWNVPLPGKMPEVATPAPELGSPENPGWNVPLPGRMPEAATAEAELGTAENPGFHARLPTRMPKIMTPKTTTNIGGEELPEIPGVIVAPEPRPLAPGEKPGSMYSVPRARLKGMAKTGKPGAVDVLRDIGQPSVLVPREGVGYPGPRMGAPYLSPEELEQALRPRYRPAAD